MRKSRHLAWITWLLVGTQTAIASSQTVELQPKEAIAGTAKTLAEAGFLSETLQPKTTPTQQPINPKTAQTTETERVRSLRISPRIGASFTTGAGVGYESSFTGIEGFVPLLQTPGSNLAFLQGKLLLSTDDANISSNLLLGYRSYISQEKRILGGYVAYDTRNTENASFGQLGAGFESLGEFWDILANAYIPVGETRKQTQENIFDSVIPFAQPRFQSNYLAIANQQRRIDRRFEAALSGFDVEGGLKIASLGRTGDVRGYAGFYYYDVPGGEDTLGGRARIEARPTDNFRLGLTLSSDGIFGTNLVLSLGANFPGTRPRGATPEDRVLARMGESVTRMANIAVDEQFESESFLLPSAIFAINPTTNQPLFFRHVNLGIGTGNGTFESPAGTLEAALAIAQPNDIVYVQAGTNPGIPAFTIPNGVQVLSTGPVQRIDTVQLGNIQLLGSGTGVLPTVTGTVAAGNGIVTMGSDSVLSGFAIQVAGSEQVNGIKGTNVNNVTIRDNTITNAFSEGIFLENATGKVLISNNIVRNTRNPETDTSLESGIFIWNYKGDVDLTISNNRVETNFNATNYRIDGIEVNVCRDVDALFVPKPCTAPSKATVRILDNVIAHNGTIAGGADGIDLNLGNFATAEFIISGNQLSKIPDEGVSIGAVANAAGTFTITNNTVRSVGDSGIEVDLFKPDPAISPALNLFNTTKTQFTITGNTLDTTDNDGIDFELADRADLTVTIASNTINKSGNGSSGDRGIDIQASDRAVTRATIESNIISNSSADGIRLATAASATIRGNTISASANQAIKLENVTESATITSNNITTSAKESISLTEAAGTVLINNNTISGSDNNTNNAAILRNSKGVANVTVSGNNIANSNGVAISLSGNAQGTVVVENNPITTTGTALELRVSETANLTSATIRGNTISGTPTSIEGLVFRAFDDAKTNVTISNNQIRSIAGRGIGIEASDRSNSQFTISGNTIDSAKTIAIDPNVSGNAVLSLRISGNTISNTNSGNTTNSGRGIEPDAKDASTLRLFLENNTISGSGGAGISTYAFDNSNVSVVARNNNLTNNNNVQNPEAPSAFAVEADPNSLETSPKVCVALSSNIGTGNKNNLDFSVYNGNPSGAIFQIEPLSLNTGTFKVESLITAATLNPTALPTEFSSVASGTCPLP